MLFETRKNDDDKDVLALVAALGVGAALMYFVDPAGGRRRRRRMGDRMAHLSHVAGDRLGSAGRDMINRARGVNAFARHRFGADDVDDPVVEQRVRAALGRSVSHPGAIEARVRDGLVTLRGLVLADEAPALVARIARVRGVREVNDHLERRESAGHAPSLQGVPRGWVPHFDGTHHSWSPAVRITATLAGGTLTMLALRSRARRSPVTGALGVAGMGLLVRSLTNVSLERLTGIGAGASAVTLHKSIHVAAPVEDVFDMLVEWEQWPKWMSHVREVSVSGPRRERTHWVVDGPAGLAVSWDAVLTHVVRPRVVAWRTVDGSLIAHAGRIRVIPMDDGTTRLDLTMSYNPMGGAAAHLLALLFRRDPKHQLDDDLARLKAKIETGHSPHDAAESGETTAVEMPVSAFTPASGPERDPAADALAARTVVPSVRADESAYGVGRRISLTETTIYVPGPGGVDPEGGSRPV